MQLNIANVTGVAVTSIVTLGADGDVLLAVPLGLFAGALAMFFVAVADGLQRPVPVKRRRRGYC
jgi:hypothetical protein